jgi:hypothetical protein
MATKQPMAKKQTAKKPVSSRQFWKGMELAKAAITALRIELNEATADNLALRSVVAESEAALRGIVGVAEAPRAAEAVPAPLPAPLVDLPSWRLTRVKVSPHA